MVTFLIIVRYVCNVLSIIILLRVIVSWYTSPTNILFRFFDRITRPILAPIRRIIPRVGPLDFSPLVAVVLIQVIYILLYYLLPWR